MARAGEGEVKHYIRFVTTDDIVSAWKAYPSRPPPRIDRPCRVRPTIVQSELVDMHEIPMRTYEYKQEEHREDVCYYEYVERLHTPESRKPSFEEELGAIIGSRDMSALNQMMKTIKRAMRRV